MAPKYSKRYYENVAALVGQTKTKGEMVQLLIREFKHDNPKFDRAEFLKAVRENAELRVGRGRHLR